MCVFLYGNQTNLVLQTDLLGKWFLVEFCRFLIQHSLQLLAMLQQGGWECLVCTFINSDGAKRCEMCGQLAATNVLHTRGPSSTPAPAPASTSSLDRDGDNAYSSIGGSSFHSGGGGRRGRGGRGGRGGRFRAPDYAVNPEGDRPTGLNLMDFLDKASSNSSGGGSSNSVMHAVAPAAVSSHMRSTVSTANALPASSSAHESKGDAKSTLPSDTSNSNSSNLTTVEQFGLKIRSVVEEGKPRPSIAEEYGGSDRRGRRDGRDRDRGDRGRGGGRRGRAPQMMLQSSAGAAPSQSRQAVGVSSNSNSGSSQADSEATAEAFEAELKAPAADGDDDDGADAEDTMSSKVRAAATCAVNLTRVVSLLFCAVALWLNAMANRRTLGSAATHFRRFDRAVASRACSPAANAECSASERFGFAALDLAHFLRNRNRALLKRSRPCCRMGSAARARDARLLFTVSISLQIARVRQLACPEQSSTLIFSGIQPTTASRASRVITRPSCRL